MTPPNKMMYVRQKNVERMMMQESDFFTLEMYLKHLQKEMKGFMTKSEKISKMADVLANKLDKKQAMKIKKDTKQLAADIASILGTSSSPRFSPKKSPK